MKWNGNENKRIGVSLIIFWMVVFLLLAAAYFGFKSQQEPVISTFIDTAVIKRGEVAVLSWSSSNIKELYLNINGDVEKIDFTGFIQVSPEESTIFVFSGLGKNGKTVLEKIGLSVIQPTPQIFVRIEPTGIIGKGDSATLIWQTEDAHSVNISGIGEMPVYGSKVVFPEITTKYVFTATGPGGITEQEVEVIVLQVSIYKGKIVENYSTMNLFTYKDSKNKEWYYIIFETKGEAKIIAPFDGEIAVGQSFGPEELYDQGWCPFIRVTVYDNNGVTLAGMKVHGYGLTPATGLRHIQPGEGVDVKKGRVIAICRGKFYIYFERLSMVDGKWVWVDDINMLYYYFPSLFDGK